MTRDEAIANCPAGHYIEYYGGRWIIVPLAEVIQPDFFTCQPRRIAA